MQNPSLSLFFPFLENEKDYDYENEEGERSPGQLIFRNRPLLIDDFPSAWQD